jgi:hypothetical protein
MEPLAGLRSVPTERFALTCHICKKSGDGACIQCTHESGCAAAFHPLCAQLAGLYMRITHPAGSSGENGGGGKNAAAARGAGTQVCVCWVEGVQMVQCKSWAAESQPNHSQL